MRPGEGSKILKELKLKGWQEENGTLYAPGSVQALKIIESGSKTHKKKNNSTQGLKMRSGWIDDHLNIRNKSNKTDMFIKLIEQELKVIVWPEFFFLPDRAFPFDWAIPVDADGKVLKIAVEQDGGIWMKGGGAHSRPQNIERDIEKSTLANVNGWTVIRRTPDKLLTNETLNLIRKAIELKNL